MATHARQRSCAWFAGIVSALVFAAPAVADREEALPPSRANVDLVASLRVHDAAENHIRQVATLRDYAYLGAFGEPPPVCSTPGGVYIVDVSNPSRPQEVGFIPTTPASFVPHGLQALQIDTPAFNGDVLIHTNDICAADPRAATARGGFSLWDVSDPRNAQPLALGVGDTDPVTGVPARAHRSRVFAAWDAGDRAFVLMDDEDESGNDLDVVEITDPRNPTRIAETGLSSWAGAQNAQSAGMGAAVGASAVDIAVRRIGGNWLALVGYGDAGFIVLNLNDPASPVFVEDSDYPDPDTLTDVSPPEGNAAYVDWDRTHTLVVGADEEDVPYRPLGTIASGSFIGERFGASPGGGVPPVTPATALSGPTYFVGLGCAALPAAPSPDAIAMAERGTCTFQVKFDRARAAGYQAVIVFNSTVVGNGCEGVVGPLVSGDRPFLFVARSVGYKILGIAGYDPAACRTGPNPALPVSGTPGSVVSVTGQFDGWGYVRLLDAATLAERDAYAPAEALDERYALGFGRLNASEIVTDPTHSLAYTTWHEAGFRVLDFSSGDFRETAKFTNEPGGDSWGVAVHMKPDGRRYVLAAERDTGLYVFRYGTDLRPRLTSPRTTKVGTKFRYRITVRNAGTIAETATVLRNRLARRVRFVSASATQGRCRYRRISRTVVCSLGRLQSDRSPVFVTIRVRAQTAGVVANSATLDGREVEYDTGNNGVRVETRVIRQVPRPQLTGRWGI